MEYFRIFRDFFSKIMPYSFGTSFNYWDERDSNENINKRVRLDVTLDLTRGNWRRKPKSQQVPKRRICILIILFFSINPIKSIFDFLNCESGKKAQDKLIFSLSRRRVGKFAFVNHFGCHGHCPLQNLLWVGLNFSACPILWSPQKYLTKGCRFFGRQPWGGVLFKHVHDQVFNDLRSWIFQSWQIWHPGKG